MQVKTCIVSKKKEKKIPLLGQGEIPTRVLKCIYCNHANLHFTVIYREGNGNPLQYSCLENPMDRGAWRAAVHGVARCRIQLRDFTFTFMHWRRKWQPTPVFLPGESQGQGSLLGCCLWGRIELDTTEAT